LVALIFLVFHAVAQPTVCPPTWTSPTLPLTRYVSPTGNNANDGTTVASAWLTISKAASTVSPGTTVYVRSGVYHEAVTITVSGSNSSTGWINFQNYPGENPIVDGTGLTVPTSDTGLFFIQNRILLSFKDLKFETTPPRAAQRYQLGFGFKGHPDILRYLTITCIIFKLLARRHPILMHMAFVCTAPQEQVPPITFSSIVIASRIVS